MTRCDDRVLCGCADSLRDYTRGYADGLMFDQEAENRKARGLSERSKCRNGVGFGEGIARIDLGRVACHRKHGLLHCTHLMSHSKIRTPFI